MLIYKLLHVDPTKESIEAPVVHLPGVGLVAPRRKSMEAMWARYSLASARDAAASRCAAACG